MRVSPSYVSVAFQLSRPLGRAKRTVLASGVSLVTDSQIVMHLW